MDENQYKKQLKLLVIIPAYNEVENIKQTIKNIPSYIEGINGINILVIDDGSTDNTKEIAQQAGAIVVSHTSNQGVGAALITGLNYALKRKFDLVVNIDADGQFNPTEIKKLIKPILTRQADFVAGDRFSQGRPANMPLSKYYGNKIMSRFISWLTGERFSDVSCGFRAYSREALLNLNLFGQFTYTQEMFLDLSFKKIKIKQVPIEVKYFVNRKSKVANNLLVYIYKTLKIIFRSFVYYKPLRFFSYPAIILFLIGFSFIVFLFYYKLTTGSYSPYKAYGFIGGGLVLFGLLLFIVGLLADIIDKIRQTQDKILYYEKKRD